MRLLALVLLACTSTVAQTRWPVVLPMTTEKNLPMVHISVNGNPGLTFILDSAAWGCPISKERAGALGLRATADGISSGSRGFQPVGIISGLKLKLGGLRLAPTDCYTFDMTTLNFKSRVDGVLGFPLFQKYVVEINYPRSRVRLFRRGRFRPSAKAQTFPIRVTVGPITRGSIRVRGQAPIALDLQLDTGSSHILTICTPVVDRYRLLESADDLTPGTTRGVSGPSSDMTGHIEEVRLGRFAVKNPEVRFSRQTSGAFASEEHYAANLGGDFLRHYKVTFDFPGRRVFLQ